MEGAELWLTFYLLYIVARPFFFMSAAYANVRRDELTFSFSSAEALKSLETEKEVGAHHEDGAE
ncbi:hypothetical protein ACC758_39290, partial [Rhizobium ruizarguesonis]